MDKASDFESEDCGFDPHRGHFYLAAIYYHEKATRENKNDVPLRVGFEPTREDPIRFLV